MLKHRVAAADLRDLACGQLSSRPGRPSGLPPYNFIGAYLNPPEGGIGIIPEHIAPGNSFVARLPGRESQSAMTRHQLIFVIAQPQRGQSEPEPDRQVVPQLEQVLAVLADATVPQE